MKLISPVLPNTPDIKEVVFAKDQPEYQPMPAAVVQYSDGSIGVITRYRLSWRERLRVLFFGSVWFQLLTAGSPQPQLPSVQEPFTGEVHIEK